MSGGAVDQRGPPAPQGLRPEEVALLIEELAPVLVGARLEKVFDLGPQAFLLRFRSQHGRLALLLSLRPGFTRFHVVGAEPQLPATPSEAASALRELLGNGVVTAIDQPGGDRVLRIVLRVTRDRRRVDRTLVEELFGNGGRLVVYDGERRLVRFVAGRGGLEQGLPYRFGPAPTRRHDAGLVPPFDPWPHIPEDERDGPLAFHRFLARTMAAAEQNAVRRQRCERLIGAVRREAKRLRVIIAKQDADLRAAQRWEEEQRLGELLKGALGELRRGLATITVIDYFDPELARREIELDPRKTPAENVERYFKRARKHRRSLESVGERRAAAAAELAILDELAGQLGESAGELAPDALIDAVEARFAALKLVRRGAAAGRGSRRERRQRAPATGPRRYRSREGLEILAGRNARENDRLTRTLARGNDLFFHIAQRPGPHVILKVPRGRNASPESIEDAAFLAAYLSGWRGPHPATVHWTEVKHVRKPKGAPAGAVLLGRDREYRAPYRPELLDRLVAEVEERDNP